jgi:hypothetical protein
VPLQDGPDRFNLGLSVKEPSKGLCVPGFVFPMPQEAGTGWMYSLAMIKIIDDFRREHPWVFDALEAHTSGPQEGGQLTQGI